MTLCSYCVEDCSGCQKPFCSEDYKNHQVACNKCLEMLCKNEIEVVTSEEDDNINICPICNLEQEG